MKNAHLYKFTLSDQRMARRAGVTKLIYELGFPYGLSQIVAHYADWDLEEKMTEMFRVNSRRILKFTDPKSGETIQFKHDSANNVKMSSSIFGDRWHWFVVSRYSLIYDFSHGEVSVLRYVTHTYKIAAAKVLQMMILDRWNSL